MTGSIFTDAFVSYAASFGVKCEIVPAEDDPAVMQAVTDGSADAAICIYSLGIELSRRYPVSITAISFSPLALSFAVPKGKNTDLVAGIDRLMAPGAIRTRPTAVRSRNGSPRARRPQSPPGSGGASAVFAWSGLFSSRGPSC